MHDRRRWIALFMPMLVAAAIVFAAFGRIPAGSATELQQAEDFINDLGVKLAAILSASEGNAADREQTCRDLMSTGIGFDVIGRFVLGRNWRKATPTQRENYQKMFKSYVLSTYTRRFVPFRNVGFKIIKSQKSGKRDAIVKTLLRRPKEKDIQADWRVRTVKGIPKIVDVMIGGISMAVTQRQDFAAVVKKSGIEGLLENLHSHTVTTATAGTQ